MHSTTEITKFTPAVLKAVCKQKKLTKKKFRLNTLKRVACDLYILIENPATPLHDSDREAMVDLYLAVRLALGDE